MPARSSPEGILALSSMSLFQLNLSALMTVFAMFLSLLKPLIMVFLPPPPPLLDSFSWPPWIPFWKITTNAFSEYLRAAELVGARETWVFVGWRARTCSTCASCGASS